MTFSVEGGNGTLKAMVDGSEIHTGDKVEQDKIITFTATPNSGYRVKGWKVDDAVVTGNASTTYTHTVTKGVEVKVSFESNSVPPTPPASGPYDFVEITPLAAGITGKDPTYSLPGTDNYWKGVFREGRKVKLSSYKLGKTEVPYEVWYEVRTWAESNGYAFANKGREGRYGSAGAAPTELNKKHPVTEVSWRDCIVWCNAYTQKIKGEAECVYRKSKTDTTVLKDATDTAACDFAYADMSKKGYRLPTEAEWEYAARWQGSDNTNAEQYGDVWLTKLNSASGAKGNWEDAEKTGEVAWYSGNADSKTHPVGTKKANALGLHDMSGNVWEWCFDWYDIDPTVNDAAYTSGGFVVDPQGGAFGGHRVRRGGGWIFGAGRCVVGRRGYANPVISSVDLGFRVAMSKN
ncbi:SUMF1/EgtB/PvdO family nonheme iron enzyme [Treponema medium]|uniref:SUMF1/EgtB/PvdO family nonheme iron enzyme n=1 Tax=Treponema medium TaxID=58231 RepID=UPI000685C2EC|nr:SUMF1/EgtB/PvdO family nonheme iron enzyme [Treponema medium]